MTENYNLYQTTSTLYDYDPRELIQDDIIFYKNFSKNISGPILELACGTGRVTIPLALENKNRTITGLDLSNQILEILKNKIQKQCINNIEIINGEMSNFKLNKSFSLIIISN